MLQRLTISNIFLILLFAVSVSVPSVAVANNAPATNGTIPAQTVNIGGTAAAVDVSSYFSDSDGDTLTYTATSSDTAKATVSVSSATVTIMAVAAGTATITVTATDPGGLSVNQTIAVTVNTPPIASRTISNYNLKKHWLLEFVTVELGSYFSDPDGDSLTFTTSYPSWRNIIYVHTNLGSHRPTIGQITNGGTGTVWVTFTATDSNGASVSQNITVKVSRPPTTSGTISAQNAKVSEGTVVDNLENYFSDGDNETLTYTASSSDTSKADVSVSDSTLTITGVALGTATITVTATDFAGFTATQTFSVTVVNSAPKTVGTIATQSTIHARPVTIDASSYFTDPEGGTLTYTVGVSGNFGATGQTSVSGSSVTITGNLYPQNLYPNLTSGYFTVTITATDPHGLTATQSFRFEASRNSAPTTVGTISGQSLHGVGTTTTIDASSYFSDANGDTLTYTVTSSDTTKATVRLSDANVTITVVAGGKTTITVTAADIDNATATQTFLVTATEDIADRTLVVGWGDVGITVDATVHFGRNPGDTFVYGATSSDTSVVTITTPHLPTFGNSANLVIRPVGAGTATVTAKLTYGNSRTHRSFTVTVFDGPSAIGTIPDKSLTYYPNTVGSTVDLTQYFDAYDTSVLTYSAVSSDTTKVTLSVSGGILTLMPVVGDGSSTITARATDSNAAFATQTFTVTLKGPPVPHGTISDQLLRTGGSAITISLSSYFIDPNGETLTYEVHDSFYGSDELVFSTIDGSTLKLTPDVNSQNLTKSGTVTVIAKDPGGLSGVQRFTLTVKPATIPPVANGTIPNLTRRVGVPEDVDVSGYFSGTSPDDLTYTAVSSNTSAATVSMSGATLTVTPVAQGTATVTVTATNPNGEYATQPFTVTVPGSSAPVTVGTPPSSLLDLAGGDVTYDVADYFSDADGDALTYTAVSSDTSKITVSVSGSTLIFTPVAHGTSTITVTATEAYGLSATQTISVAASSPPEKNGSVPSQSMIAGNTLTLDVSSYFSDPNGETLSYTAVASLSWATVSVSGSNLTFTSGGYGTTATNWIYLTATNASGFSVRNDFSFTVTASTPTTVGSIPNIFQAGSDGIVTINASSYFSDPNSLALTYSAASSDTSLVTVSVSGSTVTIQSPQGILGGTNVSITATNTAGLSATQSFVVNVSFAWYTGQADATPGLSSAEQLLLGQLLTYDTLIFNELHNGSDDAKDWLELRNVSNIDIPLDSWQLSLQTGNGTAVIPFPAGTVIPTGEVLLITNTEMATADASISVVVTEKFVLPQTDFALILRSPTAFGDLAGNYFQTQKERPNTAPEFTVNTVWDRVQTTVSGYRAEAWAASTYRNGLGSPGYQPSALTGDLNNDGVVNILDLVLVASQLGTTGNTAADLNGDGVVDIRDLVLVANALNNVNAAPTAKQSAAAVVNNWLRLARENASTLAATSIPEGFSYQRGIAMLEQLARALTPDTTALLANYPNPFNPETWIPYQLSKTADVTITIYASDGNVVRTLALGHQDVGMYKTRSQAAYWDGTNELGESVASGVYFYTLTAGEFTATRKMLILK